MGQVVVVVGVPGFEIAAENGVEVFHLFGIGKRIHDIGLQHAHGIFADAGEILVAEREEFILRFLRRGVIHIIHACFRIGQPVTLRPVLPVITDDVWVHIPAGGRDCPPDGVFALRRRLEHRGHTVLEVGVVVAFGEGERYVFFGGIQRDFLFLHLQFLVGEPAGPADVEGLVADHHKLVILGQQRHE